MQRSATVTEIEQLAPSVVQRKEVERFGGDEDRIITQSFGPLP